MVTAARRSCTAKLPLEALHCTEPQAEPHTITAHCKLSMLYDIYTLFNGDFASTAHRVHAMCSTCELGQHEQAEHLQHSIHSAGPAPSSRRVQWEQWNHGAPSV